MDLLHRRSTGRGVDLQSGDQRADVLPLEETIRWAGSRSGAADEATAGAEYAHEATGGRTELGRDDIAGRAPRKVLKPARRRPLVIDHLCVNPTLILWRPLPELRQCPHEDSASSVAIPSLQ